MCTQGCFRYDVIRTIIALTLMWSCSDVRADTEVVGRVKVVASDVYPDQGVVFQLDAGTATCPANTWIYFGGTGSNVASDKLKAVYIAVMLAYQMQGPLYVYFTSSCIAINVRPWS